MCGIFGYITKLPRHQRQEIHPVVEKLGIENVMRGADAHGFSYFDGAGILTTYKAIGTFRRTAMMEFWRGLEMPEIFIGHTRYATKGSYHKEENNHPLTVGDYTVVHNGIIWNDEQLTKKHDLIRYAEVDSEAIPSLISNFATKQKEKTNIEILSEYLGKLGGSQACAMIDQRYPYELYLWRNNSPCYLAYCADMKTLFFSSTVDSIRKALENKEFLVGSISDSSGVVVSNKHSTLEIQDFTFFEERASTEDLLAGYRRRNKSMMTQDDSIYGLK